MEIKKTNTNFGVKIFSSEFMKMVIDDSRYHGNFENFYKAQEKLSQTDNKIRLDVGFHLIDDKKFLGFARYQLRDDVFLGRTIDDYKLTGLTTYEIPQKDNIFTFACKKIIEMSKGDPEKNKIYQKVVKEPNPDILNMKPDLNVN